MIIAKGSLSEVAGIEGKISEAGMAQVRGLLSQLVKKEEEYLAAREEKAALREMQPNEPAPLACEKAAPGSERLLFAGKELTDGATYDEDGYEAANEDGEAQMEAALMVERAAAKNQLEGAKSALKEVEKQRNEVMRRAQRALEGTEGTRGPKPSP